jgi:phosphomethylpyrimidine synthase
MTQLQAAKAGTITREMEAVARDEGRDPSWLAEQIAVGRVVIPYNRASTFKPVGIGAGLRTKVNANLGTSPLRSCMEEELEKLRAAVDAGADAVMDLSTGGDLEAIRREIIGASPLMVGTVPIYQVSAECAEQGGNILDMTPDMFFEVIRKHAVSGVDFITVHCGVTREVVHQVDDKPRVAGVVSRGGAMHAAWIREHGEENPLYARFDRLLEICLEHDMTLSLGDGLRPGAIHDAGDGPQVAELVVLGELARKARNAGVQVMIEGPGHVPLHKVAAQVQMQKDLCGGAPFYVLGPLTTDISPGYDHISSAIGGAVAAMSGADFLCYVTPAEHLRLPDTDDVREGVIGARIAAHSGDIAKGIPGAAEQDLAMSRSRKALDWEGMFARAIDPVKARRFKSEGDGMDHEVCTMCGKFCSIHLDNLTKPEQEKEPQPS